MLYQFNFARRKKPLTKPLSYNFLILVTSVNLFNWRLDACVNIFCIYMYWHGFLFSFFACVDPFRSGFSRPVLENTKFNILKINPNHCLPTRMFNHWQLHVRPLLLHNGFWSAMYPLWIHSGQRWTGLCAYGRWWDIEQGVYPYVDVTCMILK